MENADAAFDFLRLLDVQRNLMLAVFIRVADVKLRRACAINPLVEELLHIEVIRFLDGLDEIRGDHVFPAIDFQVVPQASVESILANLLAKHVQNQPTLSISVSVKLAGVVK